MSGWVPWGTSIFSDDTAAEVRESYRDLLANGADDAEAREEIQKSILGENAELRELIEPLFWLALARTQWELAGSTAKPKPRLSR